MYYGLKMPLPGGKGLFPEFPSPMNFVELARQYDDVWIDLEKPFWWDTPVRLASGQLNSVGLANNLSVIARCTRPKPGAGLATQNDFPLREAMVCGLRRFTTTS